MRLYFLGILSWDVLMALNESEQRARSDIWNRPGWTVFFWKVFPQKSLLFSAYSFTCIYVCMIVCERDNICVHMFDYVYTCMWSCICDNVCMYVIVCMRSCMYMCIIMYVLVSVCVYTCKYTCVTMCIEMHVKTQEYKRRYWISSSITLSVQCFETVRTEAGSHWFTRPNSQRTPGIFNPRTFLWVF